MSQMPDKIWLHKDTKYNTGDIVCGYQYEFAQEIEYEGGIENFVKYVPADAFIEKTLEYLEPILTEYAGFYVGGDILQNFKKYMKGDKL